MTELTIKILHLDSPVDLQSVLHLKVLVLLWDLFIYIADISCYYSHFADVVN